MPRKSIAQLDNSLTVETHKPAPELKRSPLRVAKEAASAAKRTPVIVAKPPMPAQIPEAQKVAPPKQNVVTVRSKPSVRAHRIVNLSQPHNTNTQEGALLFALLILDGAQAAWEELRQIGPTDAELEKAMDTYFPAFLGFHTERQKGFYIGKNPEPFFVWGNTVTVSRFLAGPALLQKVRVVLCLPDRTK